MLPVVTSAAFADESFCYVTTTGRRSGKPHTIENWFAVEDESVYLLSGSGDHADWVRNLIAEPRVRLRLPRASPSRGRGRLPRRLPASCGRARRVLLLTNLGWGLEEVSAVDDLHQWAVLRTAKVPDTRPFDSFVDF